MIKFLLYTTAFFLCAVSFGQSSKTIKTITDKGKTLYYLEKASQQGEKILVENYPQLISEFGGCFSYIEKETTTCICFSKGNNPKVLLTVSFDDIANSDAGFSNDEQRNFTLHEYELFMIRNFSIREINNNESVFTIYRNTQFHFIPFIENKKREVYIITVSTIDSIVAFGNDYLLTFDDKGNYSKTKVIHSNFLPFIFSKNGANTTEKTLSSHTHNTEQDNFITETDILVLLLYAKKTGWKEHYVISEKYVSIWNCETEELRIMTIAEWDKLTSKPENNND